MIIFLIGSLLLLGPVLFFGSMFMSHGNSGDRGMVIVLFAFTGGWIPILGSIWFFRLASRME